MGECPLPPCQAFKPFAGAGQPLVPAPSAADRAAARAAAAEAAMRRSGQAAREGAPGAASGFGARHLRVRPALLRSQRPNNRDQKREV